MTELKVRAVDAEEQKSKVEVEEELLQKHEDQFEDSETTTIPNEKVEAPEVESTKEETPETETQEKPSFSDEDVLSHINERYGKTISSIDELFETREAAPELPEDIATYFKYKQETGRSLEDFVKLNKDYSKVDQDQLLASYYKTKDDYLDDEDIQAMLEDFSYDAEYEEEKDIKKKKLAKKKAIAEAKKFFEEQKAQYKIPLESRGDGIDSDTQKKLDEYQQSLKQAKEDDERLSKTRDTYLKKLNEIFNEDFKGFEFKIEDQVLSYKPAGSEDLKKTNSDFANFIKSYVGEDGQLKDYVGFHRALAIANHPDKFARFFYEKGMADAVTEDAKTTKNVDLSIKKSPEVSVKGGTQIKALSNSSDGNRLRIRKRK